MTTNSPTSGLMLHAFVMVALLAFPCAIALGDQLSSAGGNARNDFQTAQSLKLENRFNEARAKFESIAALDEPGSETWADLAADELDYGLLLHEANYWILKAGSGVGDGKALKTYLANAEQLYQQILELNSHDTERMRDTQQRLDQLYVTRQAIRQSSDAQTMSHLYRLRTYIDAYFSERGEWPEQTELAAELREILKLARLSTKRFLVKNYWRNTNDYYAILMDTEGGPDIKLTGDANGSRLERVSP